MGSPEDEVAAAVAEGRLTEDMWDIHQTARFLNVAESTLYAWRSQGHPLPSYKAGGLKYDPADVRAYLLSTKTDSAA